MAKDAFAGASKHGQSLLHGPEDRLKSALLPLVPPGIETYHLTLTTIVWSILVILFSWLATFDRQWMWGVSAMVAAQYVTDLLDGAIGRQRDTGLVKWGFYMDHFLDYIFLCAMLIGYSLLMPDNLKYVMFFVMAVICAFMVNSFLQFAATNRFRIAYWGIGPTEIRIGFIAINTLVIYLDRTIGLAVLPYLLAFASFGLLLTAYNTQRQLWKMDMAAKAERDGDVEPPGIDTQGIVIRHVLTSFVVASLAFMVLVMRIGAPFHRTVAAVIYVASWIPIGVALARMRPRTKASRPGINRIRTLVFCGIALAVCAWGAITLRPPTVGEAGGSVETIRESLAADAAAVLRIGARADIGVAGRDSLDRIAERHGTYHLVDIHTDPALHAESFLVWYAAQALHGRLTVEGHDPDVGRLAEAIRPDALLRLGFASSYLRLLESALADTTDGRIPDRRRALERLAAANVERYREGLNEMPELLLEMTHDMEPRR